MTGTCTIIIPTYNEEKNIARMTNAIRKTYPSFHILFMDDNSTDRSKEIINAMADPMVTFYVRSPEKRGLAASVIQGFEIAETDYAICMDCDFQHPISALQDIFNQMEAGAELCVGCRTSRTSMGIKRALGSELVETFCKIDFMLHRKQTTRDMMSGLFGLRCEVFRPMISSNWDNFEKKGWKVLMDFMKYMDRPVDVRYVIYTFGKRMEGESHINPKVTIMTFHQLWGLGKIVSKTLCIIYGIDYKEMYPAKR